VTDTCYAGSMDAEETPSAKEPAPGLLSEVQAFINTRDNEEGTDELADAVAATAWLRSRGFSRGRISQAERQRLVDVREALRDLLSAHDGDPQPTAVPRLNQLFVRVRLSPRLAPAGGTLVAEGRGLDAYLATLSIAIVEATVAGTWQRLKVCRASDCRWAFYDHTKNGRGAWCSMQVCGTRAKSRAYRARQVAHAHAAGVPDSR
jgi:predicted RNA-binding Zn ribbon-like protein